MWFHGAASLQPKGEFLYASTHNGHFGKILPKCCGCSCCLIVKSYPNTEQVLSHYEGTQTHPIGQEKACYNDSHDIGTGKLLKWDNFITAQDIKWIEAGNGQWVIQWVEQLQIDGAILSFNHSEDPVPKGSDLAQDAFTLTIQTEYQHEVFRNYGHAFSGVNATHNTTYYENTSLFMVIVRDKWGHGDISVFKWSYTQHWYKWWRMHSCLDDFIKCYKCYHRLLPCNTLSMKSRCHLCKDYVR